MAKVMDLSDNVPQHLRQIASHSHDNPLVLVNGGEGEGVPSLPIPGSATVYNSQTDQNLSIS